MSPNWRHDPRFKDRRMDGLPFDTLQFPQVSAPRHVGAGALGAGQMSPVSVLQRTLKAAIDCVGVGVHSGRRVKLAFRPAAPDTGIVFRRIDLVDATGLQGVDIPARFDAVSDTRLCTVLTAPGRPDARVGTVEHVMAALSAMGIDNVVVELDGPEVPILDGSSAPFLFLLDCAGVAEQMIPRRSIQVMRSVRVERGDAFVELHPLSGDAAPGLYLNLSIDFEAEAIGRQAMAVRLTETAFRRQLAQARTFAMAGEIAQLQAAGLARGGSLDNAVVVDGAKVLNPGGLRMADEFVRHKLLDAVGDLALGGRLIGRYVGNRAGHALNNQVLRALFADAASWQVVEPVMTMGWAGLPLTAAA